MSKSPGSTADALEPHDDRRAVEARFGYSTMTMTTTTTTMTSAAIAMVRVSMATSVYLMAPSVRTKIRRSREFGRAVRSKPPSGGLDGHVATELRAGGRA
jgi:hypothetical protein